MLISPQHLSPGSLVTLQRAQAKASSGFCFICPNVRATLPFSLLPPPPRTQRQVTKLSWGQSASLTKAPLQSLPYCPAPLYPPLGSFFRALLSFALFRGSSTSPGWSRGPGPERGCHIGGGGGGLTGECRRRPHRLRTAWLQPLPTEAGSACSPGVKRNTICLGQEPVARRCN